MGSRPLSVPLPAAAPGCHHKTRRESKREFSLDNWGDGKWGMKERELDVVVGAGGPPVDIMACEEGMSAAATECVMCGEGNRERDLNKT